ncbi:MAG TPA: cytochrome c oxidase assembly protein, partial [Acidimicrobiales bacterium]|nr:cytochrome c oxidase assembly protein [Acidimicrobiales bacterium]
MTAAPVLAAVVALAWAYTVGTRRLWRRAVPGRVVHRGQAAAFGAGLGVMAAALSGPLDAAAHASLAAHMLQHVALMAVAAPLLVIGTPVPALLWALPDGPRRVSGRWWRRANRSSAGPAWPWWTGAALLAHVAAVWGWHVPALYDAARARPELHALEHACFLGTAASLWWAVLGARHRATFGLGVLVVFAVALQGTLLGAAMTLAGHPWYRAYAGTASALEDQQVAGVVMWAVGGLAQVVAGVALFAAWLQSADRRRPAPGAAAAPRPAL